jgi:hypothetical protein
MGLLDLFSSSRLARQADRLANEVAHMTAQSVLSRVAPTAATMNESVARGYVRAHASVAVRAAIGRTWGQRGDLARVLDYGVHSRATSQVVHIVTNQLRMARAQKAAQRRAA